MLRTPFVLKVAPLWHNIEFYGESSAQLFFSPHQAIYNVYYNDVHRVSNFSPKDIYISLYFNIRLVMFRIVSTAILSPK